MFRATHGLRAADPAWRCSLGAEQVTFSVHLYWADGGRNAQPARASPAGAAPNHALSRWRSPTQVNTPVTGRCGVEKLCPSYEGSTTKPSDEALLRRAEPAWQKARAGARLWQHSRGRYIRGTGEAAGYGNRPALRDLRWGGADPDLAGAGLVRGLRPQAWILPQRTDRMQRGTGASKRCVLCRSFVIFAFSAVTPNAPSEQIRARPGCGKGCFDAQGRATSLRRI